jgi:hypothetical protein
LAWNHLSAAGFLSGNYVMANVFRFSPYATGSAIAPDPAKCVNGLEWNVLGAETDCGAANVL